MRSANKTPKAHEFADGSQKNGKKIETLTYALFLCGHMMTGNFVTQYIN